MRWRRTGARGTASPASWAWIPGLSCSSFTWPCSAAIAVCSGRLERRRRRRDKGTSAGAPRRALRADRHQSQLPGPGVSRGDRVVDGVHGGIVDEGGEEPQAPLAVFLTVNPVRGGGLPRRVPGVPREVPHVVVVLELHG